MKLELIHPSITLKKSYLRGLAEFQAEGSWQIELDYQLISLDFGGYVSHILSRTSFKSDIIVPHTELWGVVDNEYVGSVFIRHYLTDALRELGGNIGYDTAPSFRRRKVATVMLAQALPVARELGLSEVLLTCDDKNLGSIKVIERNGGKLEKTKFISECKSLRRYYWINLP